MSHRFQKKAMIMRRLNWLAVVCIAGAGCADASDDLSLAGGRPGMDDLIESRLGITVLPGPDGYEGLPPTDGGADLACSPVGCTPTAFDDAIQFGCEVSLTPSPRTTGTCAGAVIAAELHICAANTLLRVVEDPRGAEIGLANSSLQAKGIVSIPPQDAESNFALARLALDHANQAAVDALVAIGSSGCTLAALTAPAGTGPDLPQLTVLDELAQFHREGLTTVARAQESMLRAGATVSDSAYSEDVDAHAAADAILNGLVSRTAAAHVLVGGEMGLPALADPDSGFFAHNRLSADAQAALELMRTAAISPALIEVDSDIDTLVTAGAPISSRVGLMQNRESLLNPTSAAAAYELLGISRQGFLDARQHLREELRAFDRSPEVMLPSEPLGAGGDTAGHGIALFAASRSAPRSLEPAYWAALLRHDPTPTPLLNMLKAYDEPPAWRVLPDTNGVAPGLTYGTESTGSYPERVQGPRSVASLYAFVGSAEPLILGWLTTLKAGCPAGPTGDLCRTQVERAQAILGGAFDEITGTPVGTGPAAQIEWRYDSAEYLGEARACWFNATESQHDVRIDLRGPIGIADLSKFRVVRGHDGLDCAVRGEIEGVPCTAVQWDALVLGSNWSTDGDHITTHVAGVPVESGARPRPDTSTLFIVSLRPGVSVAIPGSFDPVVGFVLPVPPTPWVEGYRYCQTAVITPELDRAVQRLVEPSTTAPFMSTQSCAGMSMDQLIPLENELTDDGNGIESSWRYYLEQARVAAARADDLGDQLVRSGLEMDLRGEAAADELNRICGVSINVSSLQEAMAADPLPTIGGVPPCVAPYVDRGGGICSRDPVLYAAMLAARSDESGRLASCLGGDTVARATFGDTKLCIWDSNEGAPGGICGGPNPAQTACPAPVASGATTCAGLPDAPPGTSWILVEDTIGLFARPMDPVPTAPNPLDLPCAELARSREGVASLEDLRVIYASPLFSFAGFQMLGRSLSWDANVGDFSTVRYAGAAVFNTGSPNTGASLTAASFWPMGDSMPQGTTCPNPAMYNPVGVPGTPPSGAYTAAAGNVDLRTYQGSLFCLGGMRDGARTLDGGHDAVRAQRATMNDVLARAVLAARIMSGNTLAPMRLPWYRGVWVNSFSIDEAHEDVVNSDNQTLCGETARVFIDHDDSDPDGVYERPLADIGERECRVAGTSCGLISSTTEWTRCPYRAGGCFPHDFGCSGEAQLVLGSPGSAFDRYDAVPTALANWPILSTYVLRADDLSSDDLDTVLLATGGPDHALYDDEVGRWQGLSNAQGYTRYFDFWDCGDDDFDNCMDADNGLYSPRANSVGFGALTVRDWINGAELACVAARQSEPSILTSACGELPEVLSITDGYRVASFLECQANEISLFGANAIVENLPQRVVSALVAQSTGQFGNGAGDFDAQVSDIRGALIDMANARIGMSSDIRAFASKLRGFRALIAQSDRARTIEDLMLVSSALDRAADCVEKSSGTIGVTALAQPGAIAGAAAVCVNAAAQTGIAVALNQLRRANIEDSIIEAYSRFNEDVTAFGRAMSERNLTVRSSLERLDGALARVRSSQTQARRALARALLLEDDGTEAHSAVTSTYRAINNTALVRYRRAHDRALRAAFIARRSIEQRLGMSLEDIEDDVYSDDPPSAWVNRLCRLPAIDYDRIRAGSTAALDGGVGGASDVLPPDDYSGAYIGDYLDQLEGAFRSYNFVYPFHEGTDTAVISLRDDIFRSRAPCAVESGNLLFAGGNLGQREGTTRAGWRMTGCEAPGSGASPCLAVAAIDGDGYCNGSLCSIACVRGEIPMMDDDDCCPPGATTSADNDCLGAAPVSGSSFDLGWPQPHRLTFGGTGSTAASRLEQHLVLAPGRYRISWYARAGTPLAPAVADVVGVETTSGTSLIDHGPYAPIVVSGWSRVWAFVTVPTEQEVIVTIHDSYEFVVDSMIDVTGVMLEDVSDSLRGDLTRDSGTDGPLGSVSSPPAWTDAGTQDRRICADTRGLYFRSEAWEPGCVRVCPDGYDGNCSDELAEHRCFRQTSLGISSESLTRLLVSTPTGFAGGNYNYRIDNVAVNLVGTALRDCTGAGAGCYGAGNFWYSMLHAGPYVVRNARGGLYETPLFPGRLESARALASERYFTNPLSSADQSLIQPPYTRLELQGRPLAGTLILRLWDEPGFRFDRLEDVQIVLTYRYWGHQR